MSVENFDQIDGALAFLGEDTPQDCLYCGKPLSGLTALWHGPGGQNVAMHPDCAVSLGARLCRDGLNAKLLIEGKPATAGIGVGLVEG